MHASLVVGNWELIFFVRFKFQWLSVVRTSAGVPIADSKKYVNIFYYYITYVDRPCSVLPLRGLLEL